MSTAIPELIAQELLERLEDITLVNGFNFTVQSVERVNREPNETTPLHHSIVVVQEEIERNPDNDYSGNPPATAYNLPFAIYGYVRQSDRTRLDDDASVNAVQANIVKAITRRDSWYTFGGYSYNALLGNMETWRSTDHAGASIHLVAQYRVSEVDPFSNRSGVTVRSVYLRASGDNIFRPSGTDEYVRP